MLLGNRKNKTKAIEWSGDYRIRITPIKITDHSVEHNRRVFLVLPAWSVWHTLQRVCPNLFLYQSWPLDHKSAVEELETSHSYDHAI